MKQNPGIASIAGEIKDRESLAEVFGVS